jgi:hypothetical protein
MVTFTKTTNPSQGVRIAHFIVKTAYYLSKRFIDFRSLYGGNSYPWMIGLKLAKT